MCRVLEPPARGRDIPAWRRSIDHHEQRRVGEERADDLKQRHRLHHAVAALLADVEIRHGRVQVRQRRGTLRHTRVMAISSAGA